MGWDWKDGEARRGPVRLLVFFVNGLLGIQWAVRLVGDEYRQMAGGWARTEAEAMRAAEEAGDAHIREVVEAAPDEVLAEVLRARGVLREHGQCDECGSKWNESHRTGCEVGALAKEIRTPTVTRAKCATHCEQPADCLCVAES